MYSKNRGGKGRRPDRDVNPWPQRRGPLADRQRGRPRGAHGESTRAVGAAVAAELTYVQQQGRSMLRPCYYCRTMQERVHARVRRALDASHARGYGHRCRAGAARRTRFGTRL